MELALKGALHVASRFSLLMKKLNHIWWNCQYVVHILFCFVLCDIVCAIYFILMFSYVFCIVLHCGFFCVVLICIGLFSICVYYLM